MDYKLVLNAVKCKACQRVLISTSQHDFVQCEDGVFVDGGHAYMRRGGPPELIEELSILRQHKSGMFFLATDVPDARLIQWR